MKYQKIIIMDQIKNIKMDIFRIMKWKLNFKKKKK